MSVKIDPRIQKIYEAAFKPEHAATFAGLFALAVKQDARMRAEGKMGLFEMYERQKSRELLTSNDTTTTKRSSQQKIKKALTVLFFIGLGISYLWLGGEDLQDRLHSEARAQMMIEEVR